MIITKNENYTLIKPLQNSVKEFLNELKKMLLKYNTQLNKHVTIEYIMINKVNDSLRDARKLIRFLWGLKAKVNLIACNTVAGKKMNAAAPASIRKFIAFLKEHNIPVVQRYKKGDDIGAACGQLITS